MFAAMRRFFGRVLCWFVNLFAAMGRFFWRVLCWFVNLVIRLFSRILLVAYTTAAVAYMVMGGDWFLKATLGYGNPEYVANLAYIHAGYIAAVVGLVVLWGLSWFNSWRSMSKKLKAARQQLKGHLALTSTEVINKCSDQLFITGHQLVVATVEAEVVNQEVVKFTPVNFEVMPYEQPLGHSEEKPKKKAEKEAKEGGDGGDIFAGQLPTG